MNVAQQQKERLQGVIKEALRSAQSRGELTLPEIPEIGLEVPRDTSHGDFASNIALVTAKTAKKSPRDVAAIIVANMETKGFINEVQIAGPGFINFF